MNEQTGTSDFHCEAAIHNALQTLKDNKPNDRSEYDRRYAITITEIEKVQAYFKTFIIDNIVQAENEQP